MSGDRREGERYSGFVPTQYPIDSYGAGGFLFGGMSHRGSLLCLPSGVYAFAPTRFEEIDEAALAPLLAEPQGAVELAIFGCGGELRPIPRNLRQRLRACGVAVDTMSTGAACQTYNILLGEKRRVAAVLIAKP